MKKLHHLILVGLMAASSLYATNGKVTLTMRSYKEVITKDKNGKPTKKLVDTKKVLPGDIIMYKNIVDNATAKPVKNMVLNNAIPKQMIYISGSARCEIPCKILYSADGGKHFATPEKLKIKTAHGTRLARPDEYTNIRWILSKPLPPHRKTVASYKAKLR